MSPSVATGDHYLLMPVVNLQSGHSLTRRAVAFDCALILRSDPPSLNFDLGSKMAHLCGNKHNCRSHDPQNSARNQ